MDQAKNRTGEGNTSCSLIDSSPFATAADFSEYGVAGSERQDVYTGCDAIIIEAFRRIRNEIRMHFFRLYQEQL